jgi:hypothetical protein
MKLILSNVVILCKELKRFDVKRYRYLSKLNATDVCETLPNKRAKMALDRSPDPSNISEQLPRQAF